MKAKRKKIDKYRLYELSVQSPKEHTEWLNAAYREIRAGKTPLRLREDFCGTFSICCYWVTQSLKHQSMGLDLDPETLAYGKKNHLSKLTAEQQKRVKPLQKNVMSVTRPGSDIIFAPNFSFMIFKQRKMLVDYFKAVLGSLDDDGIFVLETAGGPGFIEEIKERKRVKDPETGERFTYIWHQKSFDPITDNGHYAIHFKLDDGTLIEDPFTYDWRVWSIPELRDILSDAGFSESLVYWEADDSEGQPSGEFIRASNGDNAHAWGAYVVGLKNPEKRFVPKKRFERKNT
jgi:hypothetical protein